MGRIGIQGDVPKIQETEVDVEKAFAGAQERKDFRVGVEVDLELPSVPSSDGFLQRFVGIKTGVVMVIGVADGVAERVQQMFQGLYIRVAQAQVNDVPPFFIHLGQADIHLGSKKASKKIHAFGNWHYQPNLPIWSFWSSGLFGPSGLFGRLVHLVYLVCLDDWRVSSFRIISFTK
jgi:hypothetical protein